MTAEDTSPTCNGNSGFCDRSYELRNQLYWKGLLATQNTIGGSDLTEPKCGGDVSCDVAEARIDDLTYLRSFHPSSGGIKAQKDGSDLVSNATFIMEYDSRIQTNPPPLFDAGNSVWSRELGN
jgi:hypothetical protein